MDLPGLNSVPATLREALRDYALRLRAHGGPHVLGLTLYGPVAGSAFDATLHTISNVVVLDVVELDILRRLAGEGSRFGRNYITAPLVVTPSFLQGSRDTFPLEFIEIQQRRIVLFGDDLFGPLLFDPAHVRLQCERELKVLAVGMRQAVVADGAKEAALRRAVLPALLGMLRVLRGLLWLKELRHPLSAAGVLVEVENLAGRHLPGVRRALEAPSAVDWLVFEKLYSDVETLGQIADGW